MDSYTHLTTTCGLRVFKLSELEKATKNFSSSRLIGGGDFGSEIFKGVIKEANNTKLNVLVYRITRRPTLEAKSDEKWARELIKQVSAIDDHPNLVRVVGYCVTRYKKKVHVEPVRFIVEEDACNGNLHDYLHRGRHQPLSWAKRLSILRDVARGLAYLHHDLDNKILSFKSSNILLDENLNAKLSEHATATLGPFDDNLMDVPIISMKYEAPELIMLGQLTSKSNVWSYGVFILELITGKQPYDGHRKFKKLWSSSRSNLEMMIDPKLKRQYSVESAMALAALAADHCLQDDPKQRPKMSEVLAMVSTMAETSEF
ncbi:serine/threonine-protein kinase PCRK1-like [Argentina anserina]|uniref:serine/threonine-protein kinase PCRK1-like n=1 Tax=Argentina anserina TaxID=57926 RepID=UPI00217627CB|nr:serine/threonine-protein kinase PCRK1-like [Potentilla anserina]